MKVRSLLLAASLISTVFVAHAQGSFNAKKTGAVSRSAAPSTKGYWTVADGSPLGNAFGECWRNASWTPANLPPNCQEPGSRWSKNGGEVVFQASARFDFDQSKVKTTARQVLDEVAGKAKSSGFDWIYVEGHTDALGAESYNQGLSERRAQTVKRYLVSKGIDASRIRSQGKGEANPVADNQSEEGRRQNRRVQIEVTTR